MTLDDTLAQENEELVNVQEELIAQIKRELTNFKKEPQPRRTLAVYNRRMQNVNEFRSEFLKNHNKLIRNGLDRTETYFTQETVDLFDEAYLQAFAAIQVGIDLLTPPPEPPLIFNGRDDTRTPIQLECNLPKLSIPSFNGDHSLWPSFHDAFTSSIHNNVRLSKSKKFQYLRGVITGEPELIIRHLTTSDETYDEAWQLLLDNYDDKREMFKHQMNIFSAQAPIKSEDVTAIKQLLYLTQSCINALTKLGVDTEAASQIFAYYTIQKLPSETHALCEQAFGATNEIPTWTQLSDALKTRIKTLQAIASKSSFAAASSHQNTKTKQNTSSNNNKSKGFTSKAVHAATNHPSKPDAKPDDSAKSSSSSVSCSICSKPHVLRLCPEFLNMSASDRKAQIEKLNLCFNCLAYSHRLIACQSTRNCSTCGGRHHTLIHIPKPGGESSQAITSNLATSSIEPSVANVHNGTSSISQSILLATAIVHVRSAIGTLVPIRALVDSGSQATLITERAAQRLHLQTIKTSCVINGIGSDNVELSKKYVTLDIRSTHEPEFRTNTNAFVLTKVTNILPHEKVFVQQWPHIIALTLADPTYAEPGHIDLLLGADVYDDIIRLGIRRGERGQPIAQLTAFGWILSGKVTHNVSVNRHILNCHVDTETNALLKKFWEIEENDQPRTLSTEDQWSETFFQNTHRRSADGKYVTRLPFRKTFDPSAILGHSYTIALNRFHGLERRLLRSPDLHAAYSKCINEYLELGQMKKVTSTESDHSNDGAINCCYLPHHAVIKESSSTTKLRVVFDASAQTSNGNSLNDILTTGHPLQNDLPSVISNWRFFRYVFITDIEKMYRRIDVHSEDAEFQRILWRPFPNAPIQTYKLNTITFGTRSAPYVAIRVIHQLAEDERHHFPLASDVLKHHMYVDDVLSGAHSIDATLEIQQQLIGILKSASFELRKWCSNSTEVLQRIPQEHREQKADLLLNAAESVKTLGLYWHPGDDSFHFKFNFHLDIERQTKRKVLATISRLFDPLGWLNPVVVIAKMFLKRLWQSELGWDDALSDNMSREWTNYVQQLHDIERIHISRWILTTSNIQPYQLHAFCDGSMNAYSATIYLRIVTPDGKCASNLLVAKCRISPMKTITVARLELCGATLSANLARNVRKQLAIPAEQIQSFFWTDSTVVINWLKGDPNRWKTFVCNRVNTILSVSELHQWRHVPTKHNPADISSRGMSPDKLIENSLWWNGPEWLLLNSSEWPESKVNPNQSEIDEDELKKTHVHALTISFDWMSRHSSLTKLRRLVAYWIRYKFNLRQKKLALPLDFSPISVSELRQSNSDIVKTVQLECFAQEIAALQANSAINNKSKLIQLTPFLDDIGILRVGGRLQNSSLTFDLQHPIIIPAKHHFTELLVRETHLTVLHGSTQLTLNQLRRQYWVINGRTVVRKSIHRCIKCFKNRPPRATQLMGNLPSARVTPSRPFSSTGLDYAGPIHMRIGKGRGTKTHKGYIAVFVCMATRAMHLEAVTAQSTAAFIAALTRFIARRGLCHDIYSDNGTYFVGADNHLKDVISKNQNLIEKEIMPFLTNKGIQWHFTPPAAPHFGGLWEAGVKSTKHHLHRILRDTTLTYEEMSTVLCAIEACLNSRPLSSLTDDPTDFTALTPGHFLIGDALLAAPERPIEKLNELVRWQYLQTLSQHFWRRWSVEYLSHLQTRTKWDKRQPNFQLNELVLIRDEQLPPTQWLMGRIVKLHPGRDEIVRVVTLKTKGKHLLTRPIAKICRLPIDDNNAEMTST